MAFVGFRKWALHVWKKVKFEYEIMASAFKSQVANMHHLIDALSNAIKTST